MKIKELFKKVTKSKCFDNFGYLAHFFVMLDDKFEPKENWQVGFYKKDTKEIESFSAGNEVEIADKSQAFKHDKKDVQELDLNKVKIDFDKAIDIAKQFHQEKYSSQPVKQAIVILQVLDSITTWNITFITLTYSTLNIKINAETGKIYKHDFGSLLQWGMQGKK
ncbi:PepSY domain-containing protein [Candidatus Woesearchaeota archaeon]|nr:PepSY domain-containing protein [Candidatus Woesearchaeota archaeon]